MKFETMKVGNNMAEVKTYQCSICEQIFKGKAASLYKFDFRNRGNSGGRFALFSFCEGCRIASVELTSKIYLLIEVF